MAKRIIETPAQYTEMVCELIALISNGSTPEAICIATHALARIAVQGAAPGHFENAIREVHSNLDVAMAQYQAEGELVQ